MNMGPSELKAFFFLTTHIHWPISNVFGTLSTPNGSTFLDPPPPPNRDKCAPLDYSSYREKLNCLGKPNGIKPSCYRKHLGECILELGNILGTRRKNQIFPPIHPTPKRKKRGPILIACWAFPLDAWIFCFQNCLSPFSAYVNTPIIN